MIQDIISSVPYLTTDQMREVDRAMIEDYHIELIQMMENAGRNLAHLARTRFFGGDPRHCHDDPGLAEEGFTDRFSQRQDR